MKSGTAILTSLAGLMLASTAHAQWRTTSYTLKPGWVSMYLNGDATWRTPDQHFAAMPDVEEVWRWNPNPSQVQFTASPGEPTQGTPEWSVWRRGQPQYSDLALLTGQTSYLVKLRAGAPQITLPLKQRVQPPRLDWVRTGANLLGFPTRQNGAAYPSFTSYLSTFPAALAQPNKVFRYNGGPLDASNPVRVFTPSSERLDATQAYWFEAKAVSDFFGPLHLTLSDPDGLEFGTTASSITLTVRNRTAVTQTLTFAPLPSEAPPPGQTPIQGPVALTRRTINESTGETSHLPVDAPFTAMVTAGNSLTITFGVNRAAMSGPAGSFFASLLRMTDAANMMDVHLPVSAGSASFAGLWVGDAQLTDVESKVPGFTGTAAARPFPLRWILHVDDAGRATFLSQACIGVLTGVEGAVGVGTAESVLATDKLGSAIRLTAAHMPLDRTILTAGSFGPGGSITGTIGLPFNDPVNPFIHQFHPDHDNRDARFNPVGAGVESWNVSRAVTFTFASSPPAGANGTWGSRLLTGTCAETYTGLRKDTVTATGTFTLRRISDIGTLTRP